MALSATATQRPRLEVASAKLSTPGEGEYRFLVLRSGVVFSLPELDMREVGQFVRRDDAVDNRRTVDLKCFADRRAQFSRFFRSKPLTAATAREPHKVGIGKFDAFFECRQTNAFRFEHDQPEFRIVVNRDLDGQLVLHGGEE